jgi:hypothetical protein
MRMERDRCAQQKTDLTAEPSGSEEKGVSLWLSTEVTYKSNWTYRKKCLVITTVTRSRDKNLSPRYLCRDIYNYEKTLETWAIWSSINLNTNTMITSSTHKHNVNTDIVSSTTKLRIPSWPFSPLVAGISLQETNRASSADTRPSLMRMTVYLLPPSRRDW